MSSGDIQNEIVNISQLEGIDVSEEADNKPKKNRKRKVKDYISCKFFIPHKRRYCNARPHKGLNINSFMIFGYLIN